MSTYKGYTEARNRASQKYQREHLERVQLWVKQGVKDLWKAKAEGKGMSLAAYIAWLVENDTEG